MEDLRIFALIALAMGLGELAVGAFFYWMGRRSQGWLQTQGQLIEARIGETRDTEGSIMYYPIVRYSYDAGGAVYESSRVRPGTQVHLATRGSVQQTVDRYASGPLTVFYDPAKPESAALEVGPNWLLVGILWASGSLFFLAGAALMIAAQAGLIGG